MGQSCTKAEARDFVLDNLNLPIHYIEEEVNDKTTQHIHVFPGVVSEDWLQRINNDKSSVLCEELRSIKEKEDCLDEIFQYGHRFPSESKLFKVNLTVFKKSICFRVKNEDDKKTLNLSNQSIFDVLEAQQIHVQESFKRYLSTYTSSVKHHQEKQEKVIDLGQLKHFLSSTFQVPIINISSTTDELQDSSFSVNERQPFVPVIAVIESKDSVFVFEEFSSYNLKDALDYSPAILSKSHASLTFLLYQILNILFNLQKHHVYLNTNITLQSLKLFHGTLWAGLSVFDGVKIIQPQQDHTSKEPIIKIYSGINTKLNNSSIILTEKLSLYTSEWVNCNISNFDYLMILNKLAGKKFGQSLNHPVFPWVTDFTVANGGHRDLKKTKFRLNKGDFQLDATYSSGIAGMSHGYGISLNAIQHHVSDVLSDITYYIYHARQTTKEVLCQHVRSRWVPDEYPSNIKRMYQWTPDECIPEFFFDPSIFTSIHDDLADLGLPSWIETPEEFVQYHYNILESPIVSENLHYWIDLVFGYKLEGKAAKNAKNVHLGLVDEHKDLKNYGVVQLFNRHHPKRNSFTKEISATTTDTVDGLEVRPREFSMSWEYVDLSTKEESVGTDKEDVGDVPPRNPARSFIDLNIVSTAIPTAGDDEPMTSQVVYQLMNKDKIVFDDIVEQTERMLKFEALSNPPSEKGIGKHEFGMVSYEQEEAKEEEEFSNLSDLMKLYLCLIIEITCHKSLRIRTIVPSLNERLAEDLKYLKLNDSVPSWVKGAVEFAITSLVFEDDDPSNLCLHSILHSMNGCFNFPAYFDKLYKFLSSIYNAVDCGARVSMLPGGHAGFSREIEKCSKMLPILLDSMGNEGVNLLLLFLNPLFEKSEYQLTMYLHIFPPISIALGPKVARTVFLKGLQKLFDNVSVSGDTACLLQHSYLSHILRAFGQDCFLNFIINLVLEILSLDCTGSDAPHIHLSTTTAPTSMVDASLPSESLLSYEVSPYDVNDSASLSSFNLDDMFSEQEQPSTFQMLRETSQGSMDNVSLSDSLQLEEIINNKSSGGMDTQRDEALDIGLRKSSEVITRKIHTVLSSQEILSESGVDNMIDVNATSQSLPDFVPYVSKSDKNLFLINSLGSDTVDIVKKRAESEQNKSPFTVLLEDDSQLVGNEENDNETFEDLEEIPREVSSVNHFRRSDTMLTEDGLQSVNLHQTVIESLKVSIPWLGPNLTTEHIARPLLRSMAKLLVEVADDDSSTDMIDRLLQKVRPSIDCLLEVALIYGDNIVMYLYLPHMAKLVDNALNYASVSISLGSQLVSCLQLIMECCNRLQSEIIVTHMEEFSVDLFQPLIRLLSTVKPFSTGITVKKFLSRKMVDILGLFCQKLKREYAQDVMAPLLQQFFSCFDGIYTLRVDNRGTTFVAKKYSLLCRTIDNDTPSPTPSKKSLTMERRSSVGSASSRISKTLSIDDVLESDNDDDDEGKFVDVYATFSPSLAYHAYVLFCRVLGTHYVDNTLYNSDLVWHLCTNYDGGLTHESEEGDKPSFKREMSNWLKPLEHLMDEYSSTSQRVSWQHLEGNWLKHWQRSNENPSKLLNFTNCKLQTYAGHSSAIRDIYVADNKHYFLSASRDKTVKLWLLKNHGNGTAHLVCSVTYERHSRAVFAVQGLEAKRVVASCDGEINIWDPVTSNVLNEFSTNRGHSFTCIRTLPAPSVCVAAATTEGNLLLYDIRQKRNALEWKVSPQTTTGVIRSMCVDSGGTWLAAGFSSGIFSAIDIRAGTLRGQARIHNGEILQMEAMSGNSFASTGADSVVRVWNFDKGGTLAYKSTSNETFNSLIYTKQQLAWSSNNKLTIHNPDKITQYNSYKLNPDTLKGVLSKMAIIPMNKLYLFGNENGNLVLFS